MQFFAILKDSFREAVDGFVIYAMLALSGLFLLLLGSMSFNPAPAAEVIPDAVGQNSFRVFIPDRGKSTAVAASQVTYQATNVQGNGRDVTFRLSVKPRTEANGDAFRLAVAQWQKPPGTTVRVKNNGPGRRGGEDSERVGLEVAQDIPVTAQELAAVTDEQMAAFIADQFYTHIGIDGATVRRVAGTTEPEYLFEVDAKGVTSARGWPQDIGLFFGGVDLERERLGTVVYAVEDRIVNGPGAGVAMMIAVIITAFFIPNMLRKGSIDLLISKPIGRPQLLVYKYIGGLTFIFLITTVSIGGAWMVLGLRSGHWDPRFLFVIPILTYTFAVLYAVSTVVAVLTHSAIASILVTLGFSAFLWLVGQFKSIADLRRNTGVQIMGNWPDWMYTLADKLNAVLPRTKDLDKLTSKLTAEGSMTPLETRALTGIIEFPSWGGTLGVSLSFITLMLAVACWRLNRRDC